MSIHHLIFILRIRRVHITYILRSSARTNEPRQIVRKVFGAEFVHRVRHVEQLANVALVGEQTIPLGRVALQHLHVIVVKIARIFGELIALI